MLQAQRSDTGQHLPWRWVVLLWTGLSACADEGVLAPGSPDEAPKATEALGESPLGGLTAEFPAATATARALIRRTLPRSDRLMPMLVQPDGRIMRGGDVVGELVKTPCDPTVEACVNDTETYCLINITYYVDTGEIVSIAVLFCWDEDDHGGGGPNPGRGDEVARATLLCPTPVERGQSATCTLQGVPADASLSSIQWEADVRRVLLHRRCLTAPASGTSTPHAERSRI